MHLSIDPLIFVWMLSALTGVTFAGLTARNATRTLAQLRAAGQGGAVLISAYAVRRNAYGRVAIQLTYVLVGAASMYNALAGAMVFNFGRLIAFALVLASMMQAFLTIADWIERRAVLRIIHREDVVRQTAAELAKLTAETHQEQMEELRSIHQDIAANTELTEETKQQAKASYVEANAVNEKLAVMSEATASDSHDILTEIQDTGRDTNKVAREVKDAITNAVLPAIDPPKGSE